MVKFTDLPNEIHVQIAKHLIFDRNTIAEQLSSGQMLEQQGIYALALLSRDWAEVCVTAIKPVLKQARPEMRVAQDDYWQALKTGGFDGPAWEAYRIMSDSTSFVHYLQKLESVIKERHIKNEKSADGRQRIWNSEALSAFCADTGLWTAECDCHSQVMAESKPPQAFRLSRKPGLAPARFNPYRSHREPDLQQSIYSHDGKTFRSTTRSPRRGCKEPRHFRRNYQTDLPRANRYIHTGKNF